MDQFTRYNTFFCCGVKIDRIQKICSTVIDLLHMGVDFLPLTHFLRQIEANRPD